VVKAGKSTPGADFSGRAAKTKCPATKIFGQGWERYILTDLNKFTGKECQAWLYFLYDSSAKQFPANAGF